MTEELSALEAIMVEDGDLELFPDAVVEKYKELPAGPKHARALLARAMKAEKDPQRRAKQKRHHDSYRLWMIPVSAPPSTGSLNGIGVRMYGRAANDFETGTYVSTLWFTLVYLPIFPLGSYLCSDGDGGYYVLGRVHSPRWVWFPPLVFGGMFGAVVLAGFLAGLDSAFHARVILYNGFPRPAEVAIEGQGSWTVPPNGHRAVRLPAEDLVATSTIDGMPVPLETVDLSLSGASFDETVYNIGGAGVLAVYYIVYGDGEPPETEPILDVVSVHDDLYYEFTEPPEQISTKSSRVVRSFLAAEMVDRPIAERAITLAGFAGDPQLAWRMADAALRAGDGSVEVAGMVFGLMPAEEIDGYCARVEAEQPEAIDIRRSCQSIALRNDREAALAKARAEAEAKPDSALAQYLHGRALRGSEALDAFRRALELDPSLVHAHAAVAYALESRNQDLEQALAHAERAKVLQRSDIDHLELRIRRRLGATPTELAGLVQNTDGSTYTMADMFRLQASPELYEGQIRRVSNAGGDWAVEDLMNVRANIALIAGRLDDLRRFNEGGGGLDLYLALSDGATAEDRALQVEPFDAAPDRAVLFWLLEHLEKRDPSGWEPTIESTVPGLVAALREPRSLTADGLRELLDGAPPTTVASAWFAAWRLTGKRAFGEEAKLWAMPPDLPYFQLR